MTSDHASLVGGSTRSEDPGRGATVGRRSLLAGRQHLEQARTYGPTLGTVRLVLLELEERDLAAPVLAAAHPVEANAFAVRRNRLCEVRSLFLSRLSS